LYSFKTAKIFLFALEKFKMASVGVLPPIKKERLAPDHPPKTSSIGNEVMPPITQTVQLSFSKKGTHEERVRRRLKKLRQQLPLLAKVETYRLVRVCVSFMTYKHAHFGCEL